MEKIFNNPYRRATYYYMLACALSVHINEMPENFPGPHGLCQGLAMLSDDLREFPEWKLFHQPLNPFSNYYLWDDEDRIIALLLMGEIAKDEIKW